jgi:tetratricopeptide (TPR) repeat protein
MRKIIVSIFLVLTFLCSPAMGETAADWFDKANALWDEQGRKFADSKKAIEYLNEAIKLKPDYVEAFNNRGLAYFNLGQYQRAIKDYNNALRLKPDFTGAYYNRGAAYDDLGQYQRAIEDYDNALRLKPDYVEAYNNRGVTYLLQGNNNLGCHDA